MTLRQRLISSLPDAFIVVGSAAMAVSIGMIYLPAGILVAGAMFVLAGVLMERAR